MGNASSRVKKRVPRNLRKTRSFREKAKKHEVSNKRGQETKVKGNEHYKGEEPSTVGRNTMFLGYDSDAEVLDLEEVLDGNATETATRRSPLTRDEDYSQGKLEGDLNSWDERPYLIDCSPQSQINDPERGLVESFDQQCHDDNLPICTPQSPDLVPIRLPSLTSSVTTSQWRLSHDETSQSSNRLQLAENLKRPNYSMRDVSVPINSESNEAARRYYASRSSVTTTESIPPPQCHVPFAPLACNSGEMRPSFSGTSVHLQSMRISKHLRSMSTASINNSICDREADCSNIIRDGINVDLVDKQFPRRTRCTSSTGFESTNMPLTWGKVVKDNASSIYSSSPQTSGRNTPDPAFNVRRRPSAETVRISMQTPDVSASRFNFGEDAEITLRDPGWILEQELKHSGKNEMIAFDGGRSTPSPAETDPKNPRQVSFTLHGIPVLGQRDLVTKKSIIQNGVHNFRALVPRSSTRIFLKKKDSINNLDGTEERQSKRSKSMYGLHSADKDFKYSGPSKKYPVDNEISSLFPFSSPTNVAEPLYEETYQVSNLHKIEENPPTNDEALVFRQHKLMHRLKSKNRENGQENSTQSHYESDSWNKYPSHTRAERNKVAGLSDFVYPKDFAPQLRGKNSFSGMADQNSKKASTSKRTKMSRIAKSRSMIFGKSVLKSYARLFKHQSVEFQRHGHGHKSSISVSGITEYPELEMIASVFPTAADTNSSQSAARQKPDSPGNDSVDRGQGLNAARQWSQVYQSCIELFRSSEDVSKRNSSEDKVENPTEDSFEIKIRSGSAQGYRNSISSSSRSLRDSTEELAKVFQETEASECAKVLQIAEDD